MKDLRRVIDSLEVIKDVCRHNPDCATCPLGDLVGCRLTHPDILPEDWDVHTPDVYGKVIDLC